MFGRVTPLASPSEFVCAQAFLSMLPGQRVSLQGLVQASHLNGEPGTVEEAGPERATVRLDSGRTVSVNQENITTRPRPSPGAAQPGGFEFAAAARGLGASPLPLAPLPAADARASAIPTMIWGDAIPGEFLADWARRIAQNDPSWIGRFGEDPHVYLVTTFFQTLSTIRRPGLYGWRFLTAGPSRCIQCFVYCDGSPRQLSELGTTASGFDTWWPCIVIWDGASSELPFYCPALGWQDARPWGVHVSRVRRREILAPAASRIVDSARSAAASDGGAPQPAAHDGGAAQSLDVRPAGAPNRVRCNRWTRAREAAPTCNSSSSSWEEVHEEDAGRCA